MSVNIVGSDLGSSYIWNNHLGRELRIDIDSKGGVVMWAKENDYTGGYPIGFLTRSRVDGSPTDTLEELKLMIELAVAKRNEMREER